MRRETKQKKRQASSKPAKRSKSQLGGKLLTLSPPIHSHFMLYRHYLNLQIAALLALQAIFSAFFFGFGEEKGGKQRQRRNIIFVSRELTFTHKKKTES
jgi:hypothetical protein